MILIVGTPDDSPSQIIHDKVEARGETAVYFDTTQFPSATVFSFDPAVQMEGLFRENAASTAFRLSDIRSVYRRWSRGVQAPQESDPMLQEAVYWNIESAIGSFLRCLDCLWVNSQEATEMHRYKGYQIKLMEAAGIRLPKTLITNCPEHLVAFYEQMDRKAIFKPVRGWAHTTLLSDEDLRTEQLETLSRSPVKLQEFIPGRDIRAYVVDHEIFAMEIQSATLDFREDTEAPRIPITLPDSVAADCFKINQVLDLVCSGIDLRRTPEGEYVFFEANPTPVFVYDEQVTGYPISDRMVDLLMAGERHA